MVHIYPSISAYYLLVLLLLPLILLLLLFVLQVNAFRRARPPWRHRLLIFTCRWLRWMWAVFRWVVSPKPKPPPSPTTQPLPLFFYSSLARPVSPPLLSTYWSAQMPLKQITKSAVENFIMLSFYFLYPNRGYYNFVATLTPNESESFSNRFDF